MRRISPGLVILAIALIGSLAFAAYAVTVRDTSQIPLFASGGGGARPGVRRARAVSAEGDLARRPRRTAAPVPWDSPSAVASRPSSASGASPGRSSCSLFPVPGLTREPSRPRADQDPLLDSGRPVPPSSRGLGRHPFKVEIRGSNPLGGTLADPRTRRLANPFLSTLTRRQRNRPRRRSRGSMPPASLQIGDSPSTNIGLNDGMRVECFPRTPNRRLAVNGAAPTTARCVTAGPRVDPHGERGGPRPREAWDVHSARSGSARNASLLASELLHDELPEPRVGRPIA